jgi:hypothetical protein
VRPELKALELADLPRSWETLGFSVQDGTFDIGGVRVQLGADGLGITGWRLAGLPTGTREIDGLRTVVPEPSSVGERSPAPAPEHPNGAIAVDHVVVMTPDFDRTAAALEGAGMPLRRVVATRGGGRMGFRRLGAAILELVEASGGEPGPASFWGLVVVVADLDALAERLAGRLGSIRGAVQPGRRIATLSKSARLGQAVAFMSPELPS